MPGKESTHISRYPFLLNTKSGIQNLINKLTNTDYMNIMCTNTISTLGTNGGKRMIVLDMSDKRPIYEQIEDRFKELIALGVLQTDEKIPSVRQLAIDLSINPNTIQRAYTELERDGFIYSVKGRGNFVADVSDKLPTRKKRYYNELDEILEKAEGYLLTPDDVIEHVEQFYKQNPMSGVKGSNTIDNQGGNSDDRS